MNAKSLSLEYYFSLNNKNKLCVLNLDLITPILSQKN